MSSEQYDAALASLRVHLDRCAVMIKAPMRPDIKVTIIVRAPEALPYEALIATNDDLAVARDALAFFAGTGI